MRTAAGPQRNRLHAAIPASAVHLLRLLGWLIVVIHSAFTASADSQDRFDGGLPRWRQGSHDCGARFAQQVIDLQGGRFGTPAERITVVCGTGTTAELIYPLAPAAVIDEFQASLWFRAQQTCGPFGVRVRFPGVADPQTGQPVAVVVQGAVYSDAGQWQALQVGDVRRQLNLKQIALRSQFGSHIDLSQPYIDALVMNAYQRPGSTTVWIDDLETQGNVPVDVSRLPSPPPSTARHVEPFAAQQILCILQYRGEPMDWLKQIGIDAILLDQPPTESQLRDASKQGLRMIAPPPPYVVTSWEPFLDLILGWQIGSAVDLAELPLVRRHAEEVKKFPAPWQRPLVMTVLEGWREAATVGDVFIRELPCVTRGVTSSQAIQTVADAQHAVGRPHPWLVSIDLSPPEGLLQQLDAAAAIGASPASSFVWHAFWLRSVAALRTSPRGMVFRTTRPLDSGDNASQQQATLLRMVCHLIKGFEPLAAGALVQDSVASNLDDFHIFALQQPQADAALILAVAQDGQSLVPRAGEGRILEVAVNPKFPSATALRLVAGRPIPLDISQKSGAATVSIVSPDLVEAILVTNQPDVASRFAARWQSLTHTATTDRLLLVTDELFSGRAAWQSLRTMAPRSQPPWALLSAAANSLADAQNAMQVGQWQQASSLVRRADAFQLRTRNLLYEQLLPRDGALVSIPTLMAPGGIHLHLASPPFIGQGDWRQVPIPAPINARSAPPNPWTHDRRLEQRAEINVEYLSSADVGVGTSIRVAAWPREGQALRGGYEGTTMRVRSPEFSGLAGEWIRIDAAIRTPLGFTGPEEGVLMYDSVTGAELGVLVPGGGAHAARLYRLVPPNQNFRVVFEVLGAGEAWIDHVAVFRWQATPAATEPLPLRPLN